MWRGFFGVEGQYDIVRATFTDGTNVPRIPPQRIGGGVYFRSAAWLARVNLLHAFKQDDVALVGETPTDGYNLLRAELCHTTVLRDDAFGRKQITVGVVGNNLLNEDIRNSRVVHKGQCADARRGREGVRECEYDAAVLAPTLPIHAVTAGLTRRCKVSR